MIIRSIGIFIKFILIDLPWLNESSVRVESNTVLLNALIRQLFAKLRRIAIEGSNLFNIPPLDPLEMEHYELDISAGILNLGLILEDVYATGFGRFVVNKCDLDLRALTFDVDIAIPQILGGAGSHDQARFKFDIQDLRFKARLNLIQSEDGKSILIKSIEDPAYQVPHFKSYLTGGISGGDINNIVNTLLEDIVVGYVHGFQKTISPIAAKAIQDGLNRLLKQLDTWKFIAPLM